LAYFINDYQWQPSPFRDAKGWRQLDGGLFFTGLWGLTRPGEVKSWNEDRMAIEPSVFQANGAIKLQSGISMFMLLTGHNRLVFKSWDQEMKTSVYNLRHSRPIIDAVVTRWYMPGSDFELHRAEASPALVSFKSECGLERAFHHLWSKHPVGIDGLGRLVARPQGTSECRVLDLSRYGLNNRDITDVSLKGVGRPLDQTNESEFVITFKDGTQKSLKPYFPVGCRLQACF
jgi:hypothetical protein